MEILRVFMKYNWLKLGGKADNLTSFWESPVARENIEKWIHRYALQYTAVTEISKAPPSQTEPNIFTNGTNSSFNGADVRSDGQKWARMSRSQ